MVRRTLLVALTVLAACSSIAPGGGDASPPPTEPVPVTADLTADPERPEPLGWERCGDLECATLTVPVDHDDPDGDVLGIAVARAPARGDKIGSLVVNPGGPGASGIDFLRSFAIAAPSELAQRFDLVSFDPRGVGRSSSIDCGWVLDEDTFDPVVASDDVDTRVDAALAQARTRVGQCVDTVGGLLLRVGTVATARDLDLLREALGDEGLTYLGLSYGTRIGAVYAELFPERVRALVLDGADRIAPEPDDTLQQYLGFEQAFRQFADLCGARDGCPLAPGEGAAVVADIDAELRAEALEAGSGRLLTRDELYVAMLSALYNERSWTTLGAGLELARDAGDGSVLQLLSDNYLDRRDDGSYSDILESFTAITCADEVYRPTEDDVRAVGRQASATLDVFAPVGPDVGVGCFGWPPPLDPLPDDLDGAGAPPIVVVGTTQDPATPYAWAQDMADALESAVLLTYDGAAHTAFLNSECVRNQATDYLVDLEPPDRLVCDD